MLEAEQISLNDSDHQDDNQEQEIARQFNEHSGSLTQEQINHLATLRPREVFDLLITANPKILGSIIYIMGQFPQEETIDLFAELRKDQRFSNYVSSIDYHLSKFCHIPEVSAKAIDALKAIGDPEVGTKSEKGQIELVSDDSVISEIIDCDPIFTKNRDWLLKCLREGALFTLRNKSDELATIAVAHELQGHILYIDYIYTSKNCRSQSYARNMFEYLLKYHAVLRAELLRGDMLSEKLLIDLGFTHDGPGEKWVYKADNVNK